MRDAIERFRKNSYIGTKVRNCVKIAVFIWDYIRLGIPGSIRRLFTLRIENDNAYCLFLIRFISFPADLMNLPNFLSFLRFSA